MCFLVIIDKNNMNVKRGKEARAYKPHVSEISNECPKGVSLDMICNNKILRLMLSCHE